MVVTDGLKTPQTKQNYETSLRVTGLGESWSLRCDSLTFWFSHHCQRTSELSRGIWVDHWLCGLTHHMSKRGLFISGFSFLFQGEKLKNRLKYKVPFNEMLPHCLIIGLSRTGRWLRWWRICLQSRRPGLNPWIRKIPWRRAWQPTPVFLPGKFQGQSSLAG